MKIQRAYVSKPGGDKIPGLLIIPESPRGGALLLPPYGATKEHMLGLAVALSEAGWATLAVDLCGHGENTTHLGPEMLQEMEAALAYLRHFGRTTAIGISLGGRLALMSTADLMVAISPAVVAEISEKGRWMFENFPSPGVREPYPGYVVELLKQLGPVRPHSRPCLILYAVRDIPAILEGAEGLKSALPNSDVVYITGDIRPDIQHENAFIRYLPRWFNHIELKLNPHVLRSTTEWLAMREPVAQTATATSKT